MPTTKDFVNSETFFVNSESQNENLAVSLQPV